MGRGDSLSAAREAKKSRALTRGQQIAAASSNRHNGQKHGLIFKSVSPEPGRADEKREALTKEIAVTVEEDCVTEAEPPVVVVPDEEVESVQLAPVATAQPEDLSVPVPGSQYNDADIWGFWTPSFMKAKGTGKHWRPNFKDKALEIVIGHETNQFTLMMRDVETLTPSRWLNDEITYAMLNLFLPSKSADCRPFIFSMLFASLLWSGDQRRMEDIYIDYDYSVLERFTGLRKPIDIFARESLVIPINKNGNHWCAIVLRLELPRITGTFIDSLGHKEYEPKRIQYAKFWLSRAFRYLRDEYMAKKNAPCPPFQFVYDVGNSPRQDNLYDCGVFMIAAVQLLVCGPRPGRKDKDIPSRIKPSHMSRFRELLQYQCMTNTFWPLYAVYEHA